MRGSSLAERGVDRSCFDGWLRATPVVGREMAGQTKWDRKENVEVKCRHCSSSVVKNGMEHLESPESR